MVLLFTVTVAAIAGQSALVNTQGLAAALYVANFGPQGEPLGHAWSLSVEEQFYGIWPAVVIGAAVATRHWRWMILAVAGVAFATFLQAPYHVSAFGAIAAGCALAVVATDDKLRSIPVELTLVCIGVMAVMSVLPVDIVASGPFLGSRRPWLPLGSSLPWRRMSAHDSWSGDGFAQSGG